MPPPIAHRVRAVACVLLLSATGVSAQTRELWHELDARAAAATPAVASSQRSFEVDTDMLRALFAQKTAPARIELPLAGGGFATFDIEPSGTMHPDLAAQFPEIHSLGGSDAMGRRLRLDISPLGIHAMIFADDGVQVIRPRGNGATIHDSFARDDYLGARPAFQCGTHPSTIDRTLAKTVSPDAASAKTVTGDVQRTYRLAMAATGEYTGFHGGTVANALAAIVTTVNRVNAVYQNDLAVRLQLIANNNLLIYTNGATDPYTNDDVYEMLGENQVNIDAVIGNANYDVGHVFGVGGGGVAGFANICETGFKAEGATGSGAPIGDPFDIDYVAHEIGHQFGGDHTFNGTAGACGGNRWGPSAFEPGSGSTIMSYAGICDAQDLQMNSDPYFHARSLAEMQETIAGTSCAVQNSADNTLVVSTSLGHVIPARTAFVLAAQASDPTAAGNLTYAWEQFDVGPAQTGSDPNPAVASGPIVRSFDPTPDPERFVPRLATLLGAPPVKGEVLPTVSRTMQFRVTVRDNQDAAGATRSADTTLTVHDTGQSFAILSPNGGGTTWTCGSEVDVTWRVAQTDAAPISCAAVDLTLSQDGGMQFDHALASGAPNTGSHTLRVPFLPGNTARLQLRCSDNIFLDINDANFAIVDADDVLAVADAAAASDEDAERTFAPAELLANDDGGVSAVLQSVSDAVGGTAVLQDGDVVFTPDPDHVGAASFDYTIEGACDSGAPQAQSTATVSFELLPVNDAPSLAPLDDVDAVALAGVAEPVTGFASVLAFGPANEASQTVQEYVVSIDDDPDGILADIAIDPSGTLGYTLSGSAGSATVGVQLRDDGGTERGGVDLSAPQTFVLTTTLPPDPDVRVHKSNDVDRVVAGSRTRYVLTLENVGSVDVAQVRLRDVLPAGLTDASWTCSASGTVCPVDAGENDVDLDVALPIGASIGVTLGATVVAPSGATLTNTAEAILPDGVVDAEPGDNMADDSDAVLPVAVFADAFESND